MNNTKQEDFWSSDFGKDYTRRNPNTIDELETETVKMYGVLRSLMNDDFLKGLDITNVLEVGSNVGTQLAMLQKQGFKNLYGIDIQEDAVQQAKQLTKNINIVQGSAFDLPFRDDYFDLVFTSGVLIHISPDDVKDVMKEIYRTSKKYIWGLEYFSEEYKAINYRYNEDYLWKGNFAQIYLDTFPGLKLVKKKQYKYVDEDNVDEMFLLEKI